MQRLWNVNKWTEITEGQSVSFPSEKVRTVRLECNAPGPACLHLIAEETDETYFLALIDGRDTVEFVAPGKFALSVEGGPVFVYTSDGDDVSTKVVDPVIFTRIVERRRRSPELEYIAAQMQVNMNRRLEAQAHELERLFLNREKTRPPLPPSAGVPGADAAPRRAADGNGTSDPSASGTV